VKVEGSLPIGAPQGRDRRAAHDTQLAGQETPPAAVAEIRLRSPLARMTRCVVWRPCDDVGKPIPIDIARPAYRITQSSIFEIAFGFPIPAVETDRPRRGAKIQAHLALTNVRLAPVWGAN
jgi:hypothetical protein